MTTNKTKINETEAPYFVNGVNTTDKKRYKIRSTYTLTREQQNEFKRLAILHGETQDKGPAPEAPNLSGLFQTTADGNELSIVPINPRAYKGKVLAVPDKPGYYWAKKEIGLWGLVRYEDRVVYLMGLFGDYTSVVGFSKWIFIMPIPEGV